MTYSEYLMYGEEEKPESSSNFLGNVKEASEAPDLFNNIPLDLDDIEGDLSDRLPFNLSEDPEEELPFCEDPEDPEDQELPFPEEEDQEVQELPEEPGFFRELRNLREFLEIKVCSNSYAVAALDSAFNKIFDRFFYVFNGQKTLSDINDVKICSLCNDDFVNQAIGSIETLYHICFLSFDVYQHAEVILKDYCINYYSFLLEKMS